MSDGVNFHGLHGYFFEDLKLGMEETFSRTITDTDMRNFTGVSGDTNPMHLNEEFAQATPFHGTIVFGMLTASLISAVIGTKLPGPGCTRRQKQFARACRRSAKNHSLQRPPSGSIGVARLQLPGSPLRSG